MAQNLRPGVIVLGLCPNCGRYGLFQEIADKAAISPVLLGFPAPPNLRDPH
jgi:hypothetical protein